MQLGCYTLDLYCDAENSEHKHGEFPHQFTAEEGGRCRKMAKRAGWKLSRNGDLCSKCSGVKPTPKIPDPPGVEYINPYTSEGRARIEEIGVKGE